MQNEKQEIHTVFPCFPFFCLTKNLSLPALAYLFRASLVEKPGAVPPTKARKLLLRNAFALLRKRRPTVPYVRRRAAFACLCAFLDSLAACQKGFFDTLQALTKSGQGFQTVNKVPNRQKQKEMGFHPLLEDW